jgi:hypothetical protein
MMGMRSGFQKVSEFRLQILLFCSATLLLFYGCSKLVEDLCGNEIQSQALSPDKRLKVVVFRRSCGATTGWSTHVSVLNSWDTLSNGEAGNVFGMDADAKVKANWETNTNVKISHPGGSEVFTQKESICCFPLFQMVRLEIETIDQQKDRPINMWK